MPPLCWQSAQALRDVYVSCFFYGPTRSGKTHICSTFPKPLFIFPRGEGSEKTIAGLPYNIVQVGSMAEMREALEHLQAQAQRGTLHEWGQTICLESLTHYSEIVERELTDHGRSDMDGKWGTYTQHIKWIRDVLFSLPAHRVLTALSRIKSKTKTSPATGGIAMPGQSAETLASSCDVLAYTERDVAGRYLTHCQTWGLFPGGSRLRGMPNVSYENFSFETCIAPHLPSRSDNGAAHYSSDAPVLQHRPALENQAKG